MSRARTEPGIVAPAVRNLDELAGQLASWLGEKLPGADGVHVVNLNYPRGAGMSHETILFDVIWRQGGIEKRQGMVVRIKPTRHAVYLDDMFDAQFQVMQLMHQSGQVRAPRPLWLEQDPALLGAPFFVMEKVAGRVAVSYPPYAKEGWLAEAAPADRRRLWEDAVTQLASIQRVPVSQAAFLKLPGGDEGFDQEVDRWRRYMNWVDPAGALTKLRDSFDKLRELEPERRPEGIVWGDARLGNMIVGPDFRVAAVVDWEQPSLGGALHDLAWWLYSDHNQTIAQGITPLAGMGTRAETIAQWSEVCGKPAETIAWYEAFACFKMECLGVRMTALRDMPAHVKLSTPGSQTAKFIEKLSG